MKDYIKPLSDYVLLKRDEREAKSKGGLFIPETAQDKNIPIKGKVLAVGKDVTQVKKGDIVVYNKWSANSQMSFLEEDLVVVKEEHIYFILASDKPVKDTSGMISPLDRKYQREYETECRKVDAQRDEKLSTSS